ncbi:MAG: DNA topoisomerase I, partial [Nanoarchaeota archaeon]|nr:DNA topoisomerase I [Nanoarchaeota archaeon]
LDNSKPVKESYQGVPYYRVTHGNKDILVGCAVGHLYGVAEKDKGKWIYPVFDIEWQPSGESRKEAAYSKKYLAALKKLAKDAKEFTVATDYDIEGEVIGWNIIRFACKQKDANRMKFSTLTKPDLVKAYETKSKHLDWGQAYAGETRHFLDWIYGINLSRALSLSIKSAVKRHQILSVGRVQGPTLKIIVSREKDIIAFKPEPFWQIELDGKIKAGDLIAWHEEDKFWDKSKAEEIVKKVKGKDGKIADTEKTEFRQMPPNPFDLTSLQTEAYRTLNIQPKITLSMAQNLYTEGYISYPRTSSQKLPKEIGYKKIIETLAKQDRFKDECGFLLKKSNLSPNEGKKTDPAHPAIYPTGIFPKLSGKEADLYELIVRRFLATFGDPAVRETMKIIIDVNNEKFIAKGTRTKEQGWHTLYGRFTMMKEEELPNAVKNEPVSVKKIKLHDKETQPPKRYTPASIIKELEKHGLGTKSTRAQIVDNLFQRGYLTGQTIEATQLGIKTVETLEKYCPEILDEELTRNFEIEMEQIREKTKKEEEVLEGAKAVLTKILTQFKKHEKSIGTELAEATRETEKELSTVGKCPKCKEGTLMIKRGKFGQFIACDKYPECTATFSLPSGAKVKVTDKVCEHCGLPTVGIIRRRGMFNVCINPDCPSKQIEDKALKKEAEKIEAGKIEKPCPQCKEGKLVLRKSVYGFFYGCSRYPKCKFTEKIEEGAKEP